MPTTIRIRRSGSTLRTTRPRQRGTGGFREVARTFARAAAWDRGALDMDGPATSGRARSRDTAGKA